MNLIEEISKRVEMLQKEYPGAFIEAFGNLQKAIEFLNNLQKQNSNEFNDVFYRTNQAYEGFLKEGSGIGKAGTMKKA
jgi:hypothetical protein